MSIYRKVRVVLSVVGRLCVKECMCLFTEKVSAVLSVVGQ